jgi:CHAT domain-containing protein
MRIALLLVTGAALGTAVPSLSAGVISRGCADGEFERSDAGRAPRLLAALSGPGSARRPRATAPLSLRAIQTGVLDAESALLEYRLGEPRSALWLVTPTSCERFDLPPRRTLELLVRRLLRRLVSCRSPAEMARARRLALEASRVLLGPVLPRLGTRRLLLSMPDELRSLPFEALPDPRAGPLFAASLWPAPLLARHEVARISSAAVLARLRARRAQRPRPSGLAVLGDSVSNPDDVRLGAARRGPPSPGSRSWPRLPHAAEELEAILRLVREGRVLRAVGFAATRELVTSGALRSFSMLHFLAHGVLDAGHPERSGLALSRFDPRGRLRPGLLRAGDVGRLKLDADLVVLSACESGGDLSDAFLAAGASGVVGSLWPVGDRATAELMPRFYRGLLVRGRTVAAALREAQLELWRDPRWNAPRHWAGFVLQGERRRAWGRSTLSHAHIDPGPSLSA